MTTKTKPTKREHQASEYAAEAAGDEWMTTYTIEDLRYWLSAGTVLLGSRYLTDLDQVLKYYLSLGVKVLIRDSRTGRVWVNPKDTDSIIRELSK
jgi:hypothetical protein